MDVEEILEKLHENEMRVLKTLQDGEPRTLRELSEATGLTRGAVERAVLWLSLKGLVELRERRVSVYEATEEGFEYAREGLPEKRLLKLLKAGGRPVSELKETFPRVGIALTWTMRRGWTRISRGFVEITEDGLEALSKTLPEEEVLARLSEKPVEAAELRGFEETVRTLVRRGLVREVVRVEKTVSPTSLGKAVAPRVPTLPPVRAVVEEAPRAVEYVEGQVVTQLTPELLRTGMWRRVRFQKYDVTLPVPKVYPGKRHFVQQFIDYVRRIWVEMGFKEMKGPILEVSFWNFDALYQPQDHPARDLADTFYMKTPRYGRVDDRELVERVRRTHEDGWETGSRGWGYRWDERFALRCVLRTHTTSISARTLAALRDVELPAKFFSVGRVFRNEVLDWKHLAEFYQTDGIVVGNVNFKHLLGYLTEYFRRLGFEKVRFRPSYFPYTEMSLEGEVWDEERGEWVELVGAGMFRPEVVKPLLGKDVNVLAWGPSLERVVMMRYGIRDIRQLYWNDLKMLREARVWMV